MSDYDELVEELAVSNQPVAVLIAAGPAATPAVRRGLLHDDDRVRIGCCLVLDHQFDDAAVPELIANLEHANGEVRRWALHALACDRCKEGECRPGEADVVPIALRMLDDRARKVRQEAVQYLGRVAPFRPDIADAIVRLRDHDPNPTVRTVASWYAPGSRKFARYATLGR